MGYRAGMLPFILIAIIIFIASYSYIAHTNETSPFERVDRLFANVDNENSPGAVIAILQDGEVIYSRGYGMANLEYDIPVTPETIFHVASVSKQFTAYAIAQLADDGFLSLDDDVRLYVPEFPDFDETITIRHLIHHTSGLRDQWELLAMAGWRLDDVITREHILKMLKHQRELNFTPGEEYLYSNMGYTVLAEIVEQVSGKSFQEWTDENIFKPLDMHNTHFHSDHRHIVPNRAYSYAPLREGGFQKSVLNYANIGATSLFTTVDDLACWLLNFDSHVIGNERVFNTMLQQGRLNNGERIDYAYALQVVDYRGAQLIGHGGADAGFRSYVGRFPENGFAVVVLSNLSGISPQQIALDIADIFLDEILEPEESPTDIQERRRRENNVLPDENYNPTPQRLLAYTGTYYSEELGTFYTIVLHNDGLVATHRRHSDIELTPIINEWFSGKQWWFRTVEFVKDSRNNIEGFRLSGGRVRNIWFEKR